MKDGDMKAFWCDCHDYDHISIISYWYNSDPQFNDHEKQVFLSMKLNKPTLWQRIKYLFGWSEWSGYFEFMITKDSGLKELKEVVEFLEE